MSDGADRRLLLNYTSSSKVLSIEAEHVGVFGSDDPWCELDHLLSRRDRAGRWSVYVDQESVNRIRKGMVDYLHFYRELTGDLVARIGDAAGGLLDTLGAVLRDERFDRPSFSRYVRQYARFLSLYRASDPVTTPQPPGGLRGDDPVSAHLDELARIRLEMRRTFQSANKELNVLLVRNARRVFGLPIGSCRSLMSVAMIDEYASDMRSWRPEEMLARTDMTIVSSGGRRTVVFDDAAFDDALVVRSSDVLSVGAATDSVVGSFYDGRRFAVDAAPKGSIVMVRTVGPEFFYKMPDIAGVVALEGGYTSHAALMAREYGVPCLVFPDPAFDGVAHGVCVRLDPEARSLEVVTE